MNLSETYVHTYTKIGVCVDIGVCSVCGYWDVFGVLSAWIMGYKNRCVCGYWGVLSGCKDCGVLGVCE